MISGPGTAAFSLAIWAGKAGWACSESEHGMSLAERTVSLQGRCRLRRLQVHNCALAVDVTLKGGWRRRGWGLARRHVCKRARLDVTVAMRLVTARAAALRLPVRRAVFAVFEAGAANAVSVGVAGKDGVRFVDVGRARRRPHAVPPLQACTGKCGPPAYTTHISMLATQS